LAIFDKNSRLPKFGDAVTFFLSRNIETQDLSDFGLIALKPPSKILAMAAAISGVGPLLMTCPWATFRLSLGMCVLSVVWSVIQLLGKLLKKKIQHRISFTCEYGAGLYFCTVKFTHRLYAARKPIVGYP